MNKIQIGSIYKYKKGMPRIEPSSYSPCRVLDVFDLDYRDKVHLVGLNEPQYEFLVDAEDFLATYEIDHVTQALEQFDQDLEELLDE